MSGPCIVALIRNLSALIIVAGSLYYEHINNLYVVVGLFFICSYETSRETTTTKKKKDNL